jgi:SagB-type dehydrogenase family enzyme
MNLTYTAWQRICGSEPEPDEAVLWELFHANSRSSLFDPQLPNSLVAQRMREMSSSLHYEDRPTTVLPRECAPLVTQLGQAIAHRRSSRGFRPGGGISLQTLTALLRAAYGETFDNADGVFPRSFRTVPSAGALYPLEIYVHSVHVQGLDAGLYHYDAARDVVRLVREGDGSRFIAEGLVQGNISLEASLMFFLTGLPRRSTFKYRERGYRFMLIEAGHVAQNLSLAAAALGLGALCIGGYRDEKIDEFLGIDGLDHASLYLVAVGHETDSGNVQFTTLT